MEIGRIYIAVCTRRELKPEWVLTFGSVLGSCFMLAGFENVRWNFNTMFPLDLARNMSIKEALSWKADYLLFLDDDVLPPATGLVKLYRDALPIVSGLVKHRRPPYTPLVARRVDRSKPWKVDDPNLRWDVEFAKNYPRDQLVEVDASGMGFVLIMREVFEKTPEPWFKFEARFGEDFYFFWKAQQAGFKNYVDTGVKCLHMADMFIGEESVLREEYLSHWKDQKCFWGK